MPAEMIQPELARETVQLPLALAGEIRAKVDVDVKVTGGGFMSRAEAAAMAITKAISEYSKGKEKEEFTQRILNYDRHLLAGDARLKEPKKFGGPGARARKQKSYR